jgi:hypothetical protein
MNKNESVGSTSQFVLAQGFQKVGDQWALLDAAGEARLFAELTADPDRPEYRPEQAYQALLASMQPGWTLRLLELFWPDPLPRRTFEEQVRTWENTGGEGLELLQQGLIFAMQAFPLPFTRRTILEFVWPGETGIGWWQGVPALLDNSGIRMRPLSMEEVQFLASWMLNPQLE